MAFCVLIKLGKEASEYMGTMKMMRTMYRCRGYNSVEGGDWLRQPTAPRAPRLCHVHGRALAHPDAHLEHRLRVVSEVLDDLRRAGRAGCSARARVAEELAAAPPASTGECCLPALLCPWPRPATQLTIFLPAPPWKLR